MAQLLERFYYPSILHTSFIYYRMQCHETVTKVNIIYTVSQKNDNDD